MYTTETCYNYKTDCIATGKKTRSYMFSEAMHQKNGKPDICMVSSY